MNVRLQFTVATAFTILMVVVIGVTVGVLYVNQVALAHETANSAIRDARAKATLSLMNFITPIGRIVETTSSYLSALPAEARTFDGMSVLDTQIQDLDQIYGVYFGLEQDGAFYQVVRLPAGTKTFSSATSAIPDNSELVLRSIEPRSGVRHDHYVYQSDWWTVTGEETGTTDFDPRERPWYKAARNSDDLIVSEVYTFSSTGRPGVTFSKRAVSSDGEFIGVVGADLTLDRLTEILNEIRIGERGQVFLLSRAGELISRSGSPTESPTGSAGTDPSALETLNGGRSGDPVVSAAIEHWKRTGEDRFEFSIDGSDEIYIASVGAFPSVYGVQPIFGVVVPEVEFVGAINRTTRRVLQASGLIVVISVLATFLVARLMSRQIQDVAAEARQISDFNLEGDFDLRSRIFEVRELGKAVSNMKSSLRSFGAYVPSDLVRRIVSSGEQVHVGGTARELTVMFSDIENFTGKTENMAPEALMVELSRYFAAMERVISDHGGTVDKYIGDAIMALWNAPSRDADHTAHACRALLACRAAEARLNASAGTSRLFPVRTRFGLHADKVVVGNVGSETRLQYTAIGAAVNLASRVEGLNKRYGTGILVTGNVAERVGDRFLMRSVDLVSPAGTSQPIMIHELIGEAGADAEFSVDNDRRREVVSWNACYELYRSGEWARAQEAFGRHRASTLASIYMERCVRFAKDPPPDDWDGVEKYDSK